MFIVPSNRMFLLLSIIFISFRTIFTSLSLSIFVFIRYILSSLRLTITYSSGPPSVTMASPRKDLNLLSVSNKANLIINPPHTHNIELYPVSPLSLLSIRDKQILLNRFSTFDQSLQVSHNRCTLCDILEDLQLSPVYFSASSFPVSSE